MSYIRPASTAADFSFSGDSAYTRPASTAADVSFFAGTQATGFVSTAFGAPRAGSIAAGFSSSQLPIPSVPLVAGNISIGALFGASQATLSQRPSGFLTTVFGLAMVEPRAVGFLSGGVSIPSIPLPAQGFAATVAFGTAFGKLFQQASGFASAMFGTPRTLPIAVGFLPTQFGAVNGLQYFKAANIGPQTVVSGAYYAFAQSLSARGYTSGGFGIPFKIQFTSSVPGQLAQAMGFFTTVVPEPKTRYAQTQTQVASGFTRISLPTPVSLRVQKASGVLTTAFGTPQTNLATYAISFVTSQTSVPLVRQTQVASGFTRISLPTPVSLRVQKASGVLTTVFGAPQTNLTTYAIGFLAAQIKVPRARQTQAAAGFAGTSLPTPVSLRVQKASGVLTTVFGVPQTNLTTYGVGFAAVQTGVPRARQTQAATGFYRPSRFGMATASRSLAYLTYGINCSARIGHPTGFVRINRTTSGFCSTRLGDPSSAVRNYVATMAPENRFGQALLRRALTC